MSGRPGRRQCWRYCTARLLGLGVGLGLGVSGLAAADAQTGAPWSIAPTDVTTYRTIEECLATFHRIGTGRGQKALEVLIADGVTTLPDSTRATTARCLARYTLNDVLQAVPVDSSTFPGLLSLFVVAHRDSDVTALVARRLAAVPATDTAARDTIAYALWRVRGEMERVWEARLRRAPTRQEQWGVRLDIVRWADARHDTARAMRELRQIVTEWEQTREKSGWVLEALRRVRHQELIDSLAQSTASYVATLRRVWAETSNDTPEWERLLTWTGVRPPPIVADYWFNRGQGGVDSTAPRPTPGKVNLVFFLKGVPRDGWNPKILGVNPIGCAPTLAGTLEWLKKTFGCDHDPMLLRALATRFPELEITLVSRTTNGFGVTAYEQPVAEVEQIRRWAYEALQLPGALAVAKGPFRKARAPDRRITFQADANETGWPGTGNGSLFLLDKSGTIVVPDWWGAQGSVDAVAEVVEALLRQPPPPNAGAGSSTGASGTASPPSP